MDEVVYGIWDGVAAMLNDCECWAFSEVTKSWVKVDRLAACGKVGLLTPTVFAEIFPGLSPLPPEAFRWRCPDQYFTHVAP